MLDDDTPKNITHMRYLLFGISLLLAYVDIHAQIRVEGHVALKNETGDEPAPFVDILLKNENDSAKVDFFAMTDMQGNFLFENLPMRPFLFEISCTGYSTYSEWIEITFPEMGNSLVLTFSLYPATTQLGEVVVSAKTIQRDLDKTTYLIMPEDRKFARFSMDLLEKIPSISIDPVSQKLVSTKGALKILINGVAASEIDLKAIPPDQVLKIENYDIPPAQYMSFGSVVNVITKNQDDGFATGATLQHAFTTGFFNDDIFLKYNKGRHQFSANYTVNYRNYTDVITETKYDYSIDSKNIERREISENPFGYTDHFPNLKYIYQEKDKYVFLAKFSPNFDRRRFEDNSEVQIRQNDLLNLRTGSGLDKSVTFNPSLNLYFWKQLANKQAVTIDMVGNLFNSKQTISKQEYNNADNHLDLNDLMDLKNRKKSFIGQIVYDKTFTLDKLSIGNKTETYTLNSIVSNSFNNDDYRSSYFTDFLYGAYTGIYGRFIYQLVLGLTYKNRHNSKNNYHSWFFDNAVILGYKINDNSNLRWVFTHSQIESGISEQSDNVIFVTDNILKKGNPYLKNGKVWGSFLIYSFNNKFVDMEGRLYYASATNMPATYYVKSGDYYILTPLNEKYSDGYTLDITGAIKPFGDNKLTVKLNGGVTKDMINNDVVGKFTHFYFPFKYTVHLKLGNWIVSHQANTVAYRLPGGTYLKKDEKNINFSLRYNRKKFSIFGSLLFAFEPSNYVTKTIAASEVRYVSDRKISDNKNMITIGFSYTFHSGKNYEENKKLINNSDADSGIFK
jgi:hypothetical protein